MRLATLTQPFSPITYADPAAPLWERAFVNAVERLSGRKTLVRLGSTRAGASAGR